MQRVLRRARRRGLRLLPDLPEPARDVQHPGQRDDRAGRPHRGPRDALRPGRRRLRPAGWPTRPPPSTAAARETRVLLFGVVLVLVVLFMPAGLLPTVETAWRRRHASTPSSPTRSARSARAGWSSASAGRSRRPRRSRCCSTCAVSKTFGGLTAVDDADLQVTEGSITALIGPNGSGKTTLFNLVTGVMKADSGEIWFDGERIDALPRPHPRPPRPGPHLPGHPALRQHDRAGERRGSGPRHRWRTLLADAVSGSEAERARHLLDYVGLGSFAHQRRRRAVVRPEEARGARPGADDGAAPDPAGRARRRDQPQPRRAALGGGPRPQLQACRSWSSSTTSRWCSTSATRSTSSPAARAISQGPPRRGPQRPGRARRLPGRRLEARPARARAVPIGATPSSSGGA